ncbi:MAG: S-layer homology domain-containing protein [Eubacteriales bacterium]
MAAIIYRYAKYKGYDINIEKNAEYKDKDSISEYAVNAVDWNNQNDIMTGDTDGKFEPKSNTTRAQAASVLMRISENFK